MSGSGSGSGGNEDGAGAVVPPPPPSGCAVAAVATAAVAGIADAAPPTAEAAAAAAAPSEKAKGESEVAAATVAAAAAVAPATDAAATDAPPPAAPADAAEVASEMAAAATSAAAASVPDTTGAAATGDAAGISPASAQGGGRGKKKSRSHYARAGAGGAGWGGPGGWRVATAPRVLVLGAGISGLACARELKHRGYRVLVLEARHRPGGRLKGGELNLSPADAGGDDDDDDDSRDGDGEHRLQQYVDLGGALIHGVEENPLTDLANDVGIPMQPVKDCLLLDKNGWPVDPKADERASRSFNDCLEESFTRCRRQQQQQQQQEVAADSKVAAVRAGASKDAGGEEERAVAVEADSFGDVFAEVCREKSVNADNHLFRWHQSNLEVSCGASFPDLGREWNEDEAYGYDGAHVATRHSWKSLVEALADGLDILYQSPVRHVHTIQPDPEVVRLALQRKQQQQALQQRQQDDQQEQQAKKRRKVAAAAKDQPSPPPAAATGTTGTAAKTAVGRRSKSPIPTPLRQSRRLRGEDAAGTRRSRRPNKGQPVDRFAPPEKPPSRGGDGGGTNGKRPRRGGGGRRDGDAVVDSSRDLPKKTIVQVTLQNGTVLEADHVVCTLPLGILKLGNDDDNDDDDVDSSDGNSDEAIVFDPPLPLEKRLAIQRLGTGLLNKCALSFDRVFWQDVDFMGLAQADNSYLILNAHCFSDKPILIFLFGGSRAKEIEAWTDADIVEDCMSVLKRICGSNNLRTGAGGGHQKVIPDPIDYRVTRWGNEQYSRMAFSYVPPGVDGFTELRNMSMPICDSMVVGDVDRNKLPTIMFAGEHTTPYHPSTIHGAFLSGIREAYRLDFALCPQANGGIQFSEQELYQRTFPVERRYFGDASLPVRVTPQAPLPSPAGSKTVLEQHSNPEEAAEESLASAANAPRRQHRRRGAAMVMNLRPRPAATTDYKNNDRHVNGTSSSAAPPPQGTRRSSRAAAISKKAPSATAVGDAGNAPEEASPDDPTTTADADIAQVRDVASLENEMLLRGMESYGRHNYEYLRDIVLPVHSTDRDGHDSSLPWTADQVRKRCNWLKPEMRRRINRSTTAWKRWVAKTVYESPTNGTLRSPGSAATTAHALGPLAAMGPASAKKGSHQNAANGKDNSKKKSRKSTEKKVRYYDDSSYDDIASNKKKVKVSTATRSGRKVYKPQTLLKGSPPPSSTSKKTTKTRSGRVVNKPL